MVENIKGRTAWVCPIWGDVNWVFKLISNSYLHIKVATLELTILILKLQHRLISCSSACLWLINSSYEIIVQTREFMQM